MPDTLKPGDRAPDFSLPDETGMIVSLKDFRGKKIVLYFYPKDDTPGCTAEACAFRDNLPRVKRSGALVLGISADGTESHGKFRRKYGLNFPLLSDTERKVVRAYGVWQKKSFLGKSYMGIVRSTFVIDEKGIISSVFPKVKVKGHVDQVLEALSA